MAGAGGIGYHFNLTPTCSTRVSNDVDFFPCWRKPLLHPRSGEGGQESGHPAQGRAFLRWSRCETAYVVWKEITARRRPDGYQYQEQSPSAHIENLKCYLLIASSIVPRDPTLGHFCIRHPDLQQSNIIVRRSSDSGWQVVSLLDWQHASILPLFLLASVPQRLQNHNDPVSQSMTLPLLPENFDELEETE